MRENSINHSRKQIIINKVGKENTKEKGKA